MRALLVLACQLHCQIVVTTHVPALAGLIPVNGVRYVTRDRSGELVAKIPDHAVLKEAAKSLGVPLETGIERAKSAVLVEGKSDATFLRYATRLLKWSGVLPACLEDISVVPVLIGGCGSVEHWVTLSLTNDPGLPWHVFLDFDTGGDPSQAQPIQKRKREVEEAGRMLSATRKHEIKNYPYPDLIHGSTGTQVTRTDTCDAEKITGRAVDMKSDNVLDTFRPRVTGDKILARSTYHDGVQEGVELKEILTEIISMTH